MDYVRLGTVASTYLDSAENGGVGFEHAANTDEEKAQYAKAVARLQQPDALFRFDPAAGCKLTQQELQAAKEDHDHDHDHDEEYNPHVWLSVENAIKQVENIENKLIEYNSINKDIL